MAVANILPHIPGTSSPLSTTDSSAGERRLEPGEGKGREGRYGAVETITRLVEELLKEARLQVPATIEVIHSKSPKHRLTEIARSPVPRVRPLMDSSVCLRSILWNYSR